MRGENGNSWEVAYGMTVLYSTYILYSGFLVNPALSEKKEDMEKR
jgi:hypothetical protein